jgi:hypothetical protein
MMTSYPVLRSAELIIARKFELSSINNTLAGIKISLVGPSVINFSGQRTHATTDFQEFYGPHNLVDEQQQCQRLETPAIAKQLLPGNIIDVVNWNRGALWYGKGEKVNCAGR